MKRAFVGRAVAEEDHAHAVLLLRLDAHADPDGDGQAAGDDAVRAEVATFDVGDVHRPPAPMAIAVFLAEEFREHARGIPALGDAVAVAAMRREDVIVGAQGQDRSDGARLLADRQVHRAVNKAARVARLRNLLELAYQMHPVQRGAQRLAVERGELGSLGRPSIGQRRHRHALGVHAAIGASRVQAAAATRTRSSCARRTWTICWRSSGAQLA